MMILACLMVVKPSLAALGSQADIIQLNNESNPIHIGKKVEIYEDPDGVLTFLEIQSINAKHWFKHPKGSPNFSYTDSYYWFRGRIENTDFNELNGLLEVSNPLLDDIEFYFLVNKKVESYFLSGSKQPYKNRALAHRNFLFPFQLMEKQQGEFYLRVHSKSSMQVPIMVAPEFVFFEDDQLELSGKSAYYGMMTIIILFNLFLLVSLREPVYLFYILFVSGFALQQLSIHGFITANFFPDSPRIQEVSVLFFMPFTILFAALFTQAFLKLRTTAPAINFVYNVYVVASVFVALSVFFLDYSTVGRIVALFAVIVSLSCVLVGPYLWIKGFTIARFYSVAWIAVAGGSMLLALNKLGIIPRTGLTENGLLFGSAAEAILLSLALADRLNMERKERTQAQERAEAEALTRKEAEEKLVHTALHHGVTGLPNRIYFENWFTENIDRDEQTHFLAFGLIHLNRFHEINQTLGHNLADGLFMRISKRVNEAMKDHPEFLALEDTEDDVFYTAVVEGVHLGFVLDLSTGENPNLAVKHLLDTLNRPIDYQDMLIEVGATGGWAIYDKDVDGPATLLRNALIAIDIGRNSNALITQYSQAINPYSPRRLAMVGELRHALETNQLELYFQPQVHLDGDQATSMEALLRWFHPEHGPVPPDEFIEIAEQSGIINPLTEWVVDQALTRIVELNELGIHLHVAVNISAVNLRDAFFPNMILAMLTKHKVKSEQLVLEVTETAMMHDPELALSVLNDVSNLGVKISIDDFGTGHSSLAYIKRLPIQEIKIDRSFVISMNQSKDDYIIVNTTVNMCHDLGLNVVAEGVENETSRHQLEEMGCDYIQGFGLSRPLPFEDLLKWITDYRNKHGA